MQIQLTLAGLRALESMRQQPLFIDEHAEAIVAAAGDPHTRALLDRGLDETPSTEDALRTQLVTNYGAVTTKYFDDALLAAVGDGTRQIVLLAGGLDTRAFRLPWPADTVVYEVDDPHVHALKARAVGETTSAARRPVHSGLAGDWQAALTGAGFDPEMPTAWLAEAVISNLPGSSHDAMFERVIEMSAPGSSIATDNAPLAPSGRPWGELVEKVAPKSLRDADYSVLAHYDERTLPGDWLSGHGWHTQTRTAHELARHYGRPFGEPLNSSFQDVADRSFLTATLPTDYLEHPKAQSLTNGDVTP